MSSQLSLAQEGARSPAKAELVLGWPQARPLQRRAVPSSQKHFLREDRGA